MRSCLLIVAALALTSCATDVGTHINSDHFKDNLIDAAISQSFSYNAQPIAHSLRDELLNHYPKGSDIGRVENYLTSIGSKCSRSNGEDKEKNKTLACQYHQYWTQSVVESMGPIPIRKNDRVISMDVCVYALYSNNIITDYKVEFH